MSTRQQKTEDSLKPPPPFLPPPPITFIRFGELGFSLVSEIQWLLLHQSSTTTTYADQSPTAAQFSARIL